MQSIDTFVQQVRDNNVMVVSSEYQPRAGVWRMFCDTISPDACLFPGQDGGHRWNPGETGADPRPYRDGQQPTQSHSGVGYTRSLRVGTWADSHTIAFAAIKASANRQIDRAAQFVAKYTRRADDRKDALFALMLQRGTLSAGFGDIADQGVAFNQSFPNFEDPNPGLIYDGKPLFAASGNAHPFKHHTAVGTQGVNLHTGTALTTANYDTVRIAMSVTSAVDEQGHEIVVKPTHMIVPASMKSTAVQVIQSTQLPGSTNNDVNPFANSVEIVEFSRLTDSASASAWWLMSVEGGVPRPFLAVDSGAPRIRYVRDELRKVLHIIAEHDFWIAVQDWRGAHCANKAAS